MPVSVVHLGVNLLLGYAESQKLGATKPVGLSSGLGTMWSLNALSVRCWVK